MLPRPIDLVLTVSCNTGYIKTSKRSKTGGFVVLLILRLPVSRKYLGEGVSISSDEFALGVDEQEMTNSEYAKALASAER